MSCNDEVKYHELRYLIVEALSGTISPEDLSNLEEILKVDSDNRKYYIEYLHVHAGLRNIFSVAKPDSTLTVDGFEQDLNEAASETSKLARDSNISLRGLDLSGLNFEADTKESKDPGLTQDILEVLELVQTSPAVEIPKEEPKRELIQKVERDFKWFPGEGNKALTRAYLALVASIMVFVGYIYFFVPDSVDRPVVAKLADPLNAVWDNDLETPDEFGDMVQSKYRLKEGYASFLFNDGASVTVEAPAELSLNSGGEMELFNGRIYATVPEKAHGFAVKAASSKIVDLGTEFGVEVDNSGTTQLHVTKGRTMLFAGLRNGKKKQTEVNEGSAMKVYNDGFVKDIPYNKARFVHWIDSKNNFIWKGGKNIDLADIVNGGNGFGTGRKGFCIMPDTGRFTATEESLLGSDSSGVTKLQSSYMRPVPDLPAVDCVVVPGYTASGDLPLSTTGLSIPDFPELTGSLRWSIKTHLSRKENLVTLNGTRYGVDEHPAILMHANCGITFDLGKIRQSVSGLSIVSFKALFGLEESVSVGRYLDPENTADIRVLLDGREVFYKSIKHVKNNAIPIEIDLTKGTARFMTLLVTCGEQSNDYDHCVFGTPELILED